MNSIDERIKRELEAENLDVDDIIGETDDLNEMFGAALKGSTGSELKTVLVIIGVIFAALVLCIWQFVTAANVSDQIFWGVWSVLAGVSIVSFELWVWMEINRRSTMRSISRLELAIRDKKPILSEE